MGTAFKATPVQNRQITQMFTPAFNARPASFMSPHHVGWGTTARSVALGVSESVMPSFVQNISGVSGCVQALKEERGFKSDTGILRQMTDNYKIASGGSENDYLISTVIKNHAGLLSGAAGLAAAATAGIGTYAATQSPALAALASAGTTAGIGAAAWKGRSDKHFYEKSETTQKVLSAAKGAALAAGIVSYIVLSEAIRHSFGFSPIPWSTAINSLPYKGLILGGVLGAPVVLGSAWGAKATLDDIAANRDSLLPTSNRNIWLTNILSRTSILFSLGFLGYRSLSVAGTLFLSFGTAGGTVPLLLGAGLMVSASLLMFKAISHYRTEGFNTVTGDKTVMNKKGHRMLAGGLGLAAAGLGIAGVAGLNPFVLASVPFMLAMLIVDYHTMVHSIGYNFAQCKTLSRPDNMPDIDEIFRSAHDMSREKSTLVVKPLMSWGEGGDPFRIMTLINKTAGIRKFVFQIGAYPLKPGPDGSLIGNTDGGPTQANIIEAENNIAKLKVEMKKAYELLSADKYLALKKNDPVSGKAPEETLRTAQLSFAERLVELSEYIRSKIKQPAPITKASVKNTFRLLGLQLRDHRIDDIINDYFDMSDDAVVPKEDIAERVSSGLQNGSLSEEEAQALHACYQEYLGAKKDRVKNDLVAARADDILNEARALISEAEDQAAVLDRERLLAGWKYYLDLYSIDVMTIAQRNDYYATRRVSKADCQDWHRTNFGNNMTEVLINPVSEDGRLLPPAYAVLAATHVYVENPEWVHGTPEINEEDPLLSRYILVPREDIPELSSERKSVSHAPDLKFVDNLYLWKGFRYNAESKTFTREEVPSDLPEGPRILFKNGARYDTDTGKYYGLDGNEIPSPSVSDGIRCRVLFVTGQKDLPVLFKPEENIPDGMAQAVAARLGDPLPADNSVAYLNRVLGTKDLYSAFSGDLQKDDKKTADSFNKRLDIMKESGASKSEIVYVRGIMNRLILESTFPDCTRSGFISSIIPEIVFSRRFDNDTEIAARIAQRFGHETPDDPIAYLNEILENMHVFNEFKLEIHSSDRPLVNTLQERLFDLDAANAPRKEKKRVLMAMNRLILESAVPGFPKRAFRPDPTGTVSENLYYLQRLPLNWQYDFYDFETNIDAEFIDIGTTSAGNAILEKDKNRTVLDLAYSVGRKFFLPLDAIMSTTGEKSDFHELRMFRSTMYMTVKTKSGKALVIPYATIDNKPAMPLIRLNMTSPPRTKEDVFSKFLVNSNNIAKFTADKDGNIMIALKPDSFNKTGTNSIEISMRVDPGLLAKFNPKNSPGNNDQMANAVADLKRRLAGVSEDEVIVTGAKIVFDWRTISSFRLGKDADGHSQLIGIYDLTAFGYETQEAVLLKSRYLPDDPQAIESIDLENFDQCVGEKPFVGYEYRFATKEEADKYLKELDLDGAVPVMHDPLNTEKPYYFYTFAFAGSDFKVRDFDGETIRNNDLKVVDTSTGPQLLVSAQRHKNARVFLHRLSDWLSRKGVENGEASISGVVGQNKKLFFSVSTKKGLTFLIDPMTYIPEGALSAGIDENGDLQFYGKKGATLSSMSLPENLAGLPIGTRIDLVRKEADSTYGVQNEIGQFVPLPCVPQGGVEFRKESETGFLVYTDKNGRELYRIVCHEAALKQGPLTIEEKVKYVLFAENGEQVSSAAIGNLPCDASRIIEVSRSDKGGIKLTELEQRITFTSNLLNGTISGKTLSAHLKKSHPELPADRISGLIEDLVGLGYLESLNNGNYIITNAFMELRSGEKMALQPENLKYRTALFNAVRSGALILSDPQNATVAISSIGPETITVSINSTNGKTVPVVLPRSSIVDNNGKPLSKILPDSTDSIYTGSEKDQWGDNYAPELLMKHGKLFIRIAKTETHEMAISGSAAKALSSSAANARLSIGANNSMAKVTKNGSSVWITSDEAILGIDGLDIQRSGIDLGKMGITVFPQHAVHEDDEHYGVFDQKTFYGEFWHGPKDPTRTNFYGYVPSDGFRKKYVGSGGNIQGYRSLTGSAINSGTPVHRDMRAAQDKYGKWEKELEYHEGEFLHLNEFSNIVEDYFESRGLLKDAGYDSMFSPEIVGLGWAPDATKQLIEQRLRWMSSIGIGPRRLIPNMKDDLRARISRSLGLSDRPQFYTLEGISQEFAGCTWYWAGSVGITRAMAPVLRFAGIISYPADPIIFPALVLGTLLSGLPSYLFSMAKIGEKTWTSLLKGPGIFSYLRVGLTENVMPAVNRHKENKLQSVTRVIDIGDGPFTITSETAGLLPERHMNRHKAVIAAETAAGLAGTIGAISSGLASPAEAMNNLPRAFDYLMNIFWPFYNAAIDSYGAKTVSDSQNPNNLPKKPIYVDKNLEPKQHRFLKHRS